MFDGSVYLFLASSRELLENRLSLRILKAESSLQYPAEQRKQHEDRNFHPKKSEIKFSFMSYSESII